MPQFILTAKHDINAANGTHVSKGQNFAININMLGINPNNLFNNQRCADALKQQLCLVCGFPPSIIDRGKSPWDIRMTN